MYNQKVISTTAWPWRPTFSPIN